MERKHDFQEPEVVLYLFLVLIESLTKSQIFRPHWLEPHHIRDEYCQMSRKYGFQESGIILHSFYAQLLLISLISSFNLKV